MKALWERLDDGEGDDLAIESKMLTRQVEAAQKRVEGNNYDTRKNVLEYDEVMREQREIIYTQRQQIINEEDSLDQIMWGMISRTISRIVDAYTVRERKEWNLEGLYQEVINVLLKPDTISEDDLKDKTNAQLKHMIEEKARERFEEKVDGINNARLSLEFEKVVILRAVDARWTDHIDSMDQLRQGIGLRAYAQNNPLVEYQTEGYDRFNAMIGGIEYDATRIFMNSEIRQNLQRQAV